VAGWPSMAYDGSRSSLAALKNLTSDVIGRFCGAVHVHDPQGTGPHVRHRSHLVVPEATLLEMAVLKGIAAHYVMRADDRVAEMTRQRDLLTGLVAALLERPEALERAFRDDWQAAADDAGRTRAVLDQVASLTDASAVAWHQRWVRGRG
jgi:dGTPase